MNVDGYSGPGRKEFTPDLGRRRTFPILINFHYQADKRRIKPMKAVRVNEWGKPVQVEDIPQPLPNNDEVLVRIHAASINPFDTAVIAGYMSFMATPPI